MNQYAVITGASKGIGLEMSKLLAKKNYHLLLVARKLSELEDVKKQIQSVYPVDVHCISLDLSQHNSAQQILTYVHQHHLNVHILINNAGGGSYGYFDHLEIEAQQKMIQLNIGSLVELCHSFIALFKQKKEKTYILNVGSTTAFQSIPTFAVYAASKSFVHSFTRSLRHELQKYPSISISLLSPGATRTNFIRNAQLEHIEATADKFSMDANVVAQIGIDGMFAEKREIIPGLLNKLNVFATRIVPRRLIERAAFNLYNKKEK